MTVFLHIQLIGTNVCLPKMHKIPPDVFLNLPGLWHNQNPETVLICIVVLCFPQSNIVWIHLCDECKKSNVLTACRMISSISWWHEQPLLLITKYQVYQVEPNMIFRTICAHTFDNSPTDPISSSLNCWSSVRGVANFVWLLSGFVCQFAISFHTFLCMTFHVIGPWGNVCFRILWIR